MNLNSIPTEQAFEVPSNLFIFDNPELQIQQKKVKKVKNVEKDKKTVLYQLSTQD